MTYNIRMPPKSVKLQSRKKKTHVRKGGGQSRKEGNKASRKNRLSNPRNKRIVRKDSIRKLKGGSDEQSELIQAQNNMLNVMSQLTVALENQARLGIELEQAMETYNNIKTNYSTCDSK